MELNTEKNNIPDATNETIQEYKKTYSGLTEGFEKIKKICKRYPIYLKLVDGIDNFVFRKPADLDDFYLDLAAKIRKFEKCSPK